MPRLPGRIRVLCVAAAAALLAAGCSGSGGSGAVGGLEKTNLIVAAVPAEDSAGLYIAQQRGYFAQEGLHVQIVPAISSADVINEQEAGKVDITAGAYPSYILADQQQHDKLKLLKVLVAGLTMAPNVQEIVVPPNSGITKMAQLAGQTITLNAKKNIGQLLVSSMLQDNAVKVSGVRYNVQPFPAMGKLLAEHKITAAWLPEPFISDVRGEVRRRAAGRRQPGRGREPAHRGLRGDPVLAEQVPAHRRGVQDRDGEGPGRRGHRPRRGAEVDDRVRRGPQAGRIGAARRPASRPKPRPGRCSESSR